MNHENPPWSRESEYEKVLPFARVRRYLLSDPTKWRRFSIWNRRPTRRDSLFFCVNPKCHINYAWRWSREDAITPKGALRVRRGNQSFALIYSKLLPCAACLASYSHEPSSTQQPQPTSWDNVPTHTYIKFRTLVYPLQSVSAGLLHEVEASGTRLDAWRKRFIGGAVMREKEFIK